MFASEILIVAINFDKLLGLKSSEYPILSNKT